MKEIATGHQLHRWSSIVVLSAALLFASVDSDVSGAEPDQSPDAVSADAIDWWSVDSGGGEASGGSWTIAAVVGQHDAGTLSGASVTLDGGFALVPEPAEPPLFADGFEDGNHGAWSSVSP